MTKKIQRDNKAAQRLVNRLQQERQAAGQKAVNRLYDLLESGKKAESAVNIIAKEYSGIFTLPGLKEALVEAAAYGYGIVPEVLNSADQDALERAVNRSWSGDGMTLSKKLHGADAAMRKAIVATVSQQLRLNASWQSAAKALYDGYNSGQAVVREQALPEYLQAVRKATAGSATQMAAARKAMRNIERLANKGAPTRILKAVYEKLLQQVKEGCAEALEKACWTAVQEKSRYVSDRIIRTEMARAWADGFFAGTMNDADVIAYRWKLSTRHPVYDVCDMLLKADMFGMGAGVFPKDKVPSLPVHPHCMCSLVEVYEGDLNAKQLAAYKAGESRVKQAGDNYLSGLSQARRQQFLGIDGAKAWANGENWQQYMRGWNGLHNPSTQLQAILSSAIIKVNKVNLTAMPHSITERKNKNGGIDRNYYGSDGKQSKQISNHDHGNLKNHAYGKFGEHAHDYLYDKQGNFVGRTTRELTYEERKENSDIL